MKMSKNIILVIFSIIMIFNVINAAPVEIEKNIKVMETILNKVIVEDSPIYFTYNNRFKGTYYENFGIIFDVESSGLFSVREQINIDVPEVPYLPVFDKDGEDNKIIIKKKIKKLKKIKEDKKELIEQKLKDVKTALEDFFVNYTRSAKIMKDNEKILVNIDLKNGRSFGGKDESVNGLQMEANVSDLKKFYSGKMNENKMKSKLKYITKNANHKNKDIEIMQNIFDTFLEKENEIWSRNDKSEGIYLPGFGAIFTIPVASSNSFLPMSVDFEVLERKLGEQTRKIEIHAKNLEKQVKKMELKLKKEKNNLKDKKVHTYIYSTDEKKDTDLIVDGDSMTIDIDLDIDDDGNENENIFIYRGRHKLDEAQIDSIMNKTKDDIIQTLSIYGSTLKSVQSNEKININLDLDAYQNKKSMSLICKKKDILDYSNGKISYEKFVDAIKIK